MLHKDTSNVYKIRLSMTILFGSRPALNNKKI